MYLSNSFTRSLLLLVELKHLIKHYTRSLALLSKMAVQAGSAVLTDLLFAWSMSKSSASQSSG
jgi:hypothetical protein